MKQDFLQTKGQEIVCRDRAILLRGAGLNGWLLPEGYMWRLSGDCDRPRRIEAAIEALCGAEFAHTFWKRYGDRFITENDIRYLASLGLNSVRLPLNARHLFCFEADGVRFQPETLKRIDDLLGWCRTHGLYVILDMHAAPGGQTGQNIDDSEADVPQLFLDPIHQSRLADGWALLAARYADEPVVAAYDLLNEPLPNWNRQYNDRVLPLYRRIIRAIRKVDPKHIIMLEGVHWATDFSVLDGMSQEEAQDNLVLQFHRYWSPADHAGVAPYRAAAERLQIPLFMGEGGENNLDWYTAAFPMYERLRIGWSFWSYKKMDCGNSPVTFFAPEGWDRLLLHLDKRLALSADEGRAIFNRFLESIANPTINEAVFRAVLRRAPVEIPCEAYDACRIVSRREPGAVLRMDEPVTLLFADGHKGVPDYQRMEGEPQPASERILTRLKHGDAIEFCVTTDDAHYAGRLYAASADRPAIRVDGTPVMGSWSGSEGCFVFPIFARRGKHRIEICCEGAAINAKRLVVAREEFDTCD